MLATYTDLFALDAQYAMKRPSGDQRQRVVGAAVIEYRERGDRAPSRRLGIHDHERGRFEFRRHDQNVIFRQKCWGGCRWLRRWSVPADACRPTLSRPRMPIARARPGRADLRWSLDAAAPSASATRTGRHQRFRCREAPGASDGALARGVRFFASYVGFLWWNGSCQAGGRQVAESSRCGTCRAWRHADSNRSSLTNRAACSWCGTRPSAAAFKAWTLALRKRFCRQFNFELQAAATGDALLLLVASARSIPFRLSDVFQPPGDRTRDILVQATGRCADVPHAVAMNTTISPRCLAAAAARKVAPQLQRMHADDPMASVFPTPRASVPGDRESSGPACQTVRDRLEEAMDFDTCSCARRPSFVVAQTRRSRRRLHTQSTRSRTLAPRRSNSDAVQTRPAPERARDGRARHGCHHASGVRREPATKRGTRCCEFATRIGRLPTGHGLIRVLSPNPTVSGCW